MWPGKAAEVVCLSISLSVCLIVSCWISSSPSVPQCSCMPFLPHGINHFSLLQIPQRLPREALCLGLAHLCPTPQHDSCPLSSAELVTAIFQPLNTPHLAAAPLFSQHYLLPSPHPPSQLLLFPSQTENLQGALIPHTRLGHLIMNP